MFPFRVHVPATTSNLGPAFDALGMALSVGNQITVDAAQTFSMTIEGEGADTLPRDESNLLARSIARGCSAAGIVVPPLHLGCEHAIPTARGLGSSAAAVVAGLLVADVLSGGGLGRDRILALATEQEGHPDNAAPALFGGLQASVTDSARVHRTTVPVPLFPHVVLFVPAFEMSTDEARALLPSRYERAEAVFNVTRTALLVAALASGRFDLLAVATQDMMHQPARSKMFPEMRRILRAAMEAGAFGAWLSGAGSTLAAFAPPELCDAVAQRFSNAARERAIPGRVIITSVELRGAVVEMPK